MSEKILLAMFVGNTILIILDASLGYHVAPNLMRLAPGEGEGTTESSVKSIRRMLAGVVTLYMFFNCLAYFRQETTLMMIVSTLILVDLGGQIYMKYRPSRPGADGDGES